MYEHDTFSLVRHSFGIGIIRIIGIIVTTMGLAGSGAIASGAPVDPPEEPVAVDSEVQKF